MKLTLPPLQIEESEGFSEEADIFERREFGERLFQLLDQVDDELVVALDAPWGEGKTTFVNMWRGLLLQKDTQHIYFDAYKNDYIDDPFLAIVGELNSLIEKKLPKRASAFKKKAISALKVFGKASVRTIIRAATANVLDETILEGAGAGSELAEATDKILTEKLVNVVSDRNAIEDFRESLQAFAKEISGERKLVFIIDELDRCKPSFALHLIEKVKHVLSVPNVVFFFVVNRTQLEKTIESSYGRGIDSSKYLQKFVHIWATLPVRREMNNSDPVKYLNYCLNQLGYSDRKHELHWARDILEELVHFYRMSPREIERSLSNFAIIQNIITTSLSNVYGALSAFLAIIKVRYPTTYKKLVDGETTYEEVLKETEIEPLRDEDWASRYEEPHIIKTHLRASLMRTGEIRALASRNEAYIPAYQEQHALASICKWMESFANS